jgi:catechol 2,3-dioxygenase-like lactoylglutathione lyase family enzyme
MKGFQFGGIQQVGIGVKNLEEAWNWYNRIFGMDCRIFEDETEANLMLPFTGGKPHSRHAVLALNLQSGGGFEVWQYSEREPREIEEEIKIGDLGILLCKMKVKDIDAAYSFFVDNECNLCGEPKEDPAGNRTFFMKDPFGNLFQMVEGASWFMKEKKVSGGSCGAVIGVSDVEKSRILYSNILGYDEVVYDSTGYFPDLSVLPGGNNEIHRVLLRRSKPFSGYFTRIFGQSILELVSVPENMGKRTYEGRYWGDPGFIHLCYDIFDMDELKKFCISKGFPFVVDSKHTNNGESFDMGEAAGHFAYVQDPDGTLIEFVESHKLPVLKKMNWYINLKKRNSYKPLPVWILKMLRFSRIKQM